MTPLSPDNDGPLTWQWRHLPCRTPPGCYRGIRLPLGNPPPSRPPALISLSPDTSTSPEPCSWATSPPVKREKLRKSLGRGSQLRLRKSQFISIVKFPSLYLQNWKRRKNVIEKTGFFKISRCLHRKVMPNYLISVKAVQLTISFKMRRWWILWTKNMI